MSKAFSVREFEAFCRKQPPERYYNYSMKFTCAAFQFLSRAGAPIDVALVGSWRDTDGAYHDFPAGVEDAVSAKPHHFSALAGRLAKIEETV